MPQPVARDLRDRLSFSRQSVVQDNAGGTRGPWQPLIPSRRVKLTAINPRRRGEEVEVAGRPQGTALYDCWIRFDSLTSQLRAGDQAIDDRDTTRVFVVRFAEDMTGRREWILLQLERGLAVG